MGYGAAGEAKAQAIVLRQISGCLGLAVTFEIGWRAHNSHRQWRRDRDGDHVFGQTLAHAYTGITAVGHNIGQCISSIRGCRQCRAISGN